MRLVSCKFAPAPRPGGRFRRRLEFGVEPDAVLAFADAVCRDHNIENGRRLALVEHVRSLHPSAGFLAGGANRC